jgi:hypothetical protein
VGQILHRQAFLESLVAIGILPPITDPARPEWIALGSMEMDPKPPTGYVVGLARLHERAFGIPTSRFFRALLGILTMRIKSASARIPL